MENIRLPGLCTCANISTMAHGVQMVLATACWDGAVRLLYWIRIPITIHQIPRSQEETLVLLTLLIVAFPQIITVRTEKLCHQIGHQTAAVLSGKHQVGAARAHQQHQETDVSLGGLYQTTILAGALQLHVMSFATVQEFKKIFLGAAHLTWVTRLVRIGSVQGPVELNKIVKVNGWC